MLTVYMSSVTKGLSAVHDVIECAPHYSASCPVVPVVIPLHSVAFKLAKRIVS